MDLCDTTSKNQQEKNLLKHKAIISKEGHLKLMKSIMSILNERNFENVFCQYLKIKYYMRLLYYIFVWGSCQKLEAMWIRLPGPVIDIAIAIPVNSKFSKNQGKYVVLFISNNDQWLHVLFQRNNN